MTSRTIPFRRISIDTAAGSEPAIDIDDCSEAVGDWPEIDTPCDDAENPGDQCVYNAELPAPDYRRCLYCKKLTG